MHPILNLLFLVLFHLLVAVALHPLTVPLIKICRRWDRATNGRGYVCINGPTVEAEVAGWDREQTGFDGVDGAVDDGVDGINDLVNEGLPEFPEGSA